MTAVRAVIDTDLLDMTAYQGVTIIRVYDFVNLLDKLKDRV